MKYLKSHDVDNTDRAVVMSSPKIAATITGIRLKNRPRAHAVDNTEDHSKSQTRRKGQSVSAERPRSRREKSCAFLVQGL